MLLTYQINLIVTIKTAFNAGVDGSSNAYYNNILWF